MRRLLLLATVLIVYGSLFPWVFDFDATSDPFFVLLHSWPHTWSRYILRDVVFNFFLYVPLGALAVLSFRRRGAATFAAGGVFGFVLSVCMELLQAYVPGRDPSMADVASNTAGAIAGAIAASIFAEPLGRAWARAARRTVLSAALLAAIWGGVQLYPFFPVFSRTRFHHVLSAAIFPPYFSFAEVFICGAEWLAAFLILEGMFGKLKTRWVAAAVLALPLRCFVVSRSLHAEELCGAAVALALWALVRPSARLRVGVVLMGAAVIVSELAPFHFTDTPSAFSWIPFAATLTAPRESGLIVICRKVFEYGAVLWLARRCGASYGGGAVVLVPALFVLEWVQRYLPGRSPEITDAMMALLMAAALWLCDLRDRRGLR